MYPIDTLCTTHIKLFFETIKTSSLLLSQTRCASRQDTYIRAIRYRIRSDQNLWWSYKVNCLIDYYKIGYEFMCVLKTKKRTPTGREF